MADAATGIVARPRARGPSVWRRPYLGAGSTARLWVPLERRWSAGSGLAGRWGGRGVWLDLAAARAPSRLPVRELSVCSIFQNRPFSMAYLLSRLWTWPGIGPTKLQLSISAGAEVQHWIFPFQKWNTPSRKVITYKRKTNFKENTKMSSRSTQKMNFRLNFRNTRIA